MVSFYKVIRYHISKDRNFVMNIHKNLRFHKNFLISRLHKTDKFSRTLCGNKMPTRCNRLYLLQILLHAQHVSGNTMPIIRSSRVLYRLSLPVVFRALVFRLSVWCGAGDYVSGLQAANRTHNLHQLLHLVGILFPHNYHYTFSISLSVHCVKDKRLADSQERDVKSRKSTFFVITSQHNKLQSMVCDAI